MRVLNGLEFAPSFVEGESIVIQNDQLGSLKIPSAIRCVFHFHTRLSMTFVTAKV